MTKCHLQTKYGPLPGFTQPWAKNGFHILFCFLSKLHTSVRLQLMTSRSRVTYFTYWVSQPGAPIFRILNHCYLSDHIIPCGSLTTRPEILSVPFQEMCLPLALEAELTSVVGAAHLAPCFLWEGLHQSDTSLMTLALDHSRLHSWGLPLCWLSSKTHRLSTPAHRGSAPATHVHAKSVRHWHMTEPGFWRQITTQFNPMAKEKHYQPVKTLIKPG